MKTCRLKTLAAFGLILPAAVTLAASGDLDPNFNGTGTRVIDFNVQPPISAAANGIAVQKDGKIVLALSESAVGASSFAVMRLNPDGSLDTTFGGGVVFAPEGAVAARAVTIDSAGRIVAAGAGESGMNGLFVVARYLPDGTPDPSFGESSDFPGIAVAIFELDTVESASSIAVQKDGKIIAGGFVGAGSGSSFALARFNADGTNDSGFGTGGGVLTAFGGTDQCLGLAIQKDGKILAAGEAVGNQFDFALARYTRTGALDRTFGTGGKVTTDFGGSESANALALQPDGKIVAAGDGFASPNHRIALARYLKNGKLDRSFGSRGKTTTELGARLSASCLGLQTNGGSVVGGSLLGAAGNDFLLARYAKNGRLDPTFSTDGWLITDLGGDDIANAVAVQQDGRIVLAGASTLGGVARIALARYLGR